MTIRPILSVENLTIRDQSGTALVAGVSLSVPCGGVLALIGETGSGKSLIAQAVLGLLPAGLHPTGQITLGDAGPIAAADTARLAALWRQQIMLVPQEPSLALDPIMRVRRQMALAGIEEREIAATLAAVDLPAAVGGAYPFTLSGGMKQRVLVATALATGAPVIIADEPTKGLDDVRVEQAIALLRDLAAAGRTLVVITHDRRVAEGLPGQVAILRAGRIVELGEGQQVLRTPTSDYGRTWLAADPQSWPPCVPCCDRSALALSAHGLTFGWPGAAPLLRDLDLHLAKGEVLAVTGPSGCGKSTLGDLLLGLRRPLAGSIDWGGVNIVRTPAAIRRLRQRYQKLHQDPGAAFLPDVPLRRQFRWLAEIRPGLDVATALPPLLDRLRLAPQLLDRTPDSVSGGEAQRLALARILLLDPLVIVADEPTSRLDLVTQREVMVLLRDLVAERGLSLLLITHDRALVHAVADTELRLG